MSNNCTKEFSIAVTACIDWNTLAWGTGFAVVLNAGATGSFTPNGVGTGNAFAANLHANNPAGNGAVRNGATISYKGPACNFLLNFVWSHALTQVGSSASMLLTGSHFIFLVNLTVQPDGTYSFPFTIPDTGGGTDNYTFTAQIFVGAGAADFGVLNGNLTNV